MVHTRKNNNNNKTPLPLPLSMVETVRYLTASPLCFLAGRVHLALWRLKYWVLIFLVFLATGVQAGDTVLASEAERPFIADFQERFISP